MRLHWVCLCEISRYDHPFPSHSPSTLLLASLILVPILGVTWALSFFVVGDGVAVLHLQQPTGSVHLYHALHSEQRGTYCTQPVSLHTPSLVPRPSPRARKNKHACREGLGTRLGPLLLYYLIPQVRVGFLKAIGCHTAARHGRIMPT